jgi:hypothetical protein
MNRDQTLMIDLVSEMPPGPDRDAAQQTLQRTEAEHGFAPGTMTVEDLEFQSARDEERLEAEEAQLDLMQRVGAKLKARGLSPDAPIGPYLDEIMAEIQHEDARG